MPSFIQQMEDIIMSKSSITIIASEETFQNLSTFTTIDELNKTVRYYKEKFADKLTKSTLAVLCHLQNYSAKYLGLSYKSKSNIANDLGISRRTVIRACQLLESLGIVKQYEMLRPTDKQQTVNAIVIQPIVTIIDNQTSDKILSNVTRDKQPVCHTKTTSFIKQDHKNNNKIRTQSVNSSNQSIKEPINLIPNWIDSNFARLSSYYFHNSADIVEMYRIATIHGRIAKLSSVTVSQVATEALKATVYRIKQGKVKSVRGYFDGVCKRLFKRERVSDLFLSVFESQI